MLSGIQIICFAASYAVALALEVTRLVLRSRVRSAVMRAFAGAGFLAHTLFLCNRVLHADGSFLSSKQVWCLMAAWALAAVYLCLSVFRPRAAFGIFLLPLVLGLVGAGALLDNREPFARHFSTPVLGMIHGASILLATVAVLVGFVAGLMYLLQVYRLKRRLPPRRGLWLPSLEWLGRINGRAMVVAALMLGVGVFSGIALGGLNPAARTGWKDPLVLTSLLMFIWLTLATGINFFYGPGRQGLKVAHLTLVSFLLLVIALGLGLFVQKEHAIRSSAVERIEIPYVRAVAAAIASGPDTLRQPAFPFAVHANCIAPGASTNDAARYSSDPVADGGQGIRIGWPPIARYSIELRSRR